MLQQTKEKLVNRKSGGFTLMELLIVIAIIAVLVAIAIPTFAAQLDNAKDSADKANARALYALAQAEWMSNPNNEIKSTFAPLNDDHKVVVVFEDGSSQSFTFSDRASNVTVDFTEYGAVVRVDGKANNESGITYPEP